MGIKFEKLSNLKNLQDLWWIRMSKKQVEEHNKDMKQREVEGETRKGKGKSVGDDDGNTRENKGDEIDSSSDSEPAQPSKQSGGFGKRQEGEAGCRKQERERDLGLTAHKSERR
ncbi:hypothetical protein IW261DRAFT_1425095 [Armillaria novae-zelandiae]|uniref:Uncharacterized protein n=1 Tax=Armillaria novae-zelandiae TaxID=153914 RepID=A0AA39NTF2_9AGAR|nr:hypothetical protein IW261DRAFT_1425095 [Armillaria novae-zelandiae]